MFEATFPIALAPMAGVTDYAMRSIWRSYGAWPLYSEMVSAKAIVMGNKKTWELFPHADERDVAVQLFGSDPETMGAAAKVLTKEGHRWIDINMGCPVPKVAGHGEGSALFCDPERAAKVVEAVAGSGATVTVKMRVGWEKIDPPAAVAFAKVLEKAGAKALAVHGRSRSQYYAGKADWNTIAEVVSAVSIPVLANGDVTDLASAKDILRHTQAQGIMIGRAARGNPWLFRTLRKGLEAEAYEKEPTLQERKAAIRLHLEALIQDKGSYVAFREMRKHLTWYTHGLRHAASLRRLGSSIQSFDDVEKFLAALDA